MRSVLGSGLLLALGCGPTGAIVASSGTTTDASETAVSDTPVIDTTERVRYVLLDDTRCGDMVLGDFDANGSLDLFALPNAGFFVPAQAPVYTFLGGPEGLAEPEVHCCVELLPRGVEVLDINGDGRDDPVFGSIHEFLVGDLGDSDDVVLSFMRGPLGGFLGPSTLTAAGTPYSLSSAAIAVGELAPGTNAVAIGVHNRVETWSSDGLGLVRREATLELEDTVLQLGVVDVDASSGPDLVAVLSSSFVKLVNQGDGTFAVGETVTAPMGASQLRIADLDGDGHDDLVLADDEALAIVLGPEWSAGPTLPETLASPFAPPFAIGELGGDEGVDLVVRREDDVVVLNGTGDGAFVEGVVLPGAEPPIYDLEIGDLNADGTADIAVCDAGGLLLTYR